MNAPTGNLKAAIDFYGCQHWSQELPYRAIIAVAVQPTHGTTLYQVAGSACTPKGAEKALRTALEIHGGNCFYCKNATAVDTSISPTLDHIEATAIGGKSELSNLVVACKQCNLNKGQTRIDAFNPKATKEWLTCLQDQIQSRLNKI